MIVNVLLLIRIAGYLAFEAMEEPLCSSGYLPFVLLGTTDAVETVYLPKFDDGVSVQISIPTGFPFGNSNQSSVYVSILIETY